MQVKTIETQGALRQNCYVLVQDGCSLVVDPGSDFETIVKEVGNTSLIGILITHHHLDHIGALLPLQEKFSVSVYDFASCCDLEMITVGPFSFQVIATPGHTADSITFYFAKEQIMFTGDFLFHHEIGRCDLPTGDFRVMQKSIQKIKTYPGDIIVYPGHEEGTTLQEEKDNNPYF